MLAHVGKTGGAGETLTERSRSDVDEVESRRGMTLDVGVQLTKSEHLLTRQKTGLLPGSVEHRASMTLKMTKLSLLGTLVV